MVSHTQRGLYLSLKFEKILRISFVCPRLPLEFGNKKTRLTFLESNQQDLAVPQ